MPQDTRNLENPNIYICPGYRRIRGVFLDPDEFPSEFNSEDPAGLTGGYAYNAEGVKWLGLGALSNVKRDTPVRENAVANPSEMILIGDAAFYSNWGLIDGRRYALGVGQDLGIGSTYLLTTLITPDTDPNAFKRRHADAWVTGFVDGHVEESKTKQLYDIRSPARLKRWNRDNLPHQDLLEW
jgi:hypothetical protein